MIWGKTWKQKNEKITRCRKWFAWHPIKLIDGRWCWWQWVWVKEWYAIRDHGVDYYFILKNDS